MSTIERHRVGPGYRHAAKLVRPGPVLGLADATLKWYEIAPADAPVPREIRTLARASLRGALSSRALRLCEEVGFAIVHRCGESFYFLLVCTWRNDNELWETVWAKAGDDEPRFGPWPSDETHHPTFCVWELAAVCHERKAWTDFLRSPRDDTALDAYLRCSYDGDA